MHLYYFARAAITNYYRTGGLNNRDLFHHSVGGQKLKIQVPVCLVSPEATHPAWFADGCLLPVSSQGFLSLCTHPWCRSLCLNVFLLQGHSPVGVGPTLVVSQVVQTVKNLPVKQETQVQFLSLEDSLEKGMATHSSTLAWKILWREKLAGYSLWGGQESHSTELLTVHFISLVASL